MTVSDKRLNKALLDVATLSVKDPAYLPLFERLQAEVDARQNQTDALTRARLLASSKKRPPPGVASFMSFAA